MRYFFYFFMVLIALHPGCTQNRKLGGVLADEIANLGGNTNRLDELRDITGAYSLKRDQFGAAVTVDGVHFRALTNAFTKAYGEPRNYSPAAQDHGPILIYKSGEIAILVMETPHGVLINLTNIKP